MIGGIASSVFAAKFASSARTANAHYIAFWNNDDRKKFSERVRGYPITPQLVSIGRTMSRLGSYVATYHWRRRVMSMGFVMTRAPSGSSYLSLARPKDLPVFLDERHGVSAQNGGSTAQGPTTRC